MYTFVNILYSVNEELNWIELNLNLEKDYFEGIKILKCTNNKPSWESLGIILSCNVIREASSTEHGVKPPELNAECKLYNRYSVIFFPENICRQ